MFYLMGTWIESRCDDVSMLTVLRTVSLPTPPIAVPTTSPRGIKRSRSPEQYEDVTLEGDNDDGMTYFPFMNVRSTPGERNAGEQSEFFFLFLCFARVGEPRSS